MLTIQSSFKGLDPRLMRSRTQHGVRQGWFTVGDILQKEFRKQVMSKNKTGRIYRIKGRLHRASAPSQTAANITGHYKNSIGYKVQSWDELEFGNNAEYAGFLEEGTSKMLPRPGLRNSINSIRANRIAGIIEREIAKAMKR